MVDGRGVEGIRRELEQYQRNSRKTSWLLRQLGKKIWSFPKDLSVRMQKSLKKRRVRRLEETRAELFAGEGATPSAADIGGPQGFFMSAEMMELIAGARMLDPEVGTLHGHERNLILPIQDHDYQHFKKARAAIPRERYDAIVLMPAGRMGGADLVAAVLSEVLSQAGSVLILRTDDSDWDCPHWYSDRVDSVDVSAQFRQTINTERTFYALLSQIGARKIFNVNSRLGFETFAKFGKQLSQQCALYAYYFCADRTPEGHETGYPVWYIHPLFRYLDGALLDSRYLAEILAERYAIPETELHKLKQIYTPAQVDIASPPMVERALSETTRARPRILWGGRLDRQKRFDLVVDIARAMTDVDFICWGKAVLDSPPNIANLPINMTLNPPFTNFDDLPLTECDGWLYTSEWDGLPTILIELGALGMPIAASAVGGVPELIDNSTGWPVPEGACIELYVATLREMINSPDARRSRSMALQNRVRERHSRNAYAGMIHAL